VKALLAPVARYYADKLQIHGPRARGADWNSDASQTLRFEQLLKVTHGRRRFSVNDYGCGYGALVEHLLGSGWQGHYRGFDISTEMIAQARELHAGRPDCTFTTEEAALEPADYCLASGIFNVRLEADEDAWGAHILATLDNLAGLSTQGFAFNVLTRHCDAERRRPDLYYADPLLLFEHCRKSYSRHVALLHDYPLYEFTLLVQTGSARSA